MNQLVKRIGVYCLVVAALVGLDQWVKYLTVVHLKGNPAKELIPGVFELTYVENRGAAFGMLQNKRIFFLIFTVIVIVLIAIFLMKVPMTKRMLPLRIIIILFIGGSIGNWIDRLLLTYVVDMFYFSLINFAVFNVADSLVVVSTILMAFYIIFYYKEEDFGFIRRKAKHENHSTNG